MPTATEKRSNPVVAVGVFAVVAIIAVLVIRTFTREVVAVRVAPVTHQDLVSTVSTNGKVEPIEEFQAHAPTAGVVERIFVSVGQKVQKGQLLVKLNDADALSHMASAKASLRSAEAANSDLAQGGTQEERLSIASDLSRAQLQQQQAVKDLAALQILQQKGAAAVSEVESAASAFSPLNSACKAYRSAPQTAIAPQTAPAPPHRSPSHRPPWQALARLMPGPISAPP